MGASCSHVLALSRASDRHVSMFAEVVDLLQGLNFLNRNISWISWTPVKDKKASAKKKEISHKSIANYQ